MRYEFHVEARTEFLEVVTRYQGEVHGLGERFVTEVGCIGVLLENPRIGALFGSKLRFLSTK